MKAAHVLLQLIQLLLLVPLQLRLLLVAVAPLPRVTEGFIIPSVRPMRDVLSSSTQLETGRYRGLELRREGPTPTEGNMVLYVKAAEDGLTVGDCPFAHFVRMVLEEKNLPYQVQPCTPQSKPNWLVVHFQGKMPALQHSRECYTESGVIADYLEYFFSEPSLAVQSNQSEAVLDGFFPAVANYVRTPEGVDQSALENLRSKLDRINQHLSQQEYLDGDHFSLLDCRLTPQLYHLYTTVEGFKGGVPNLAGEFPHVQAYYDRCSARPSFASTIYHKKTVLWGWGNARAAQK
eukprot:Nitzschia sp. Nitz4//scaffold12_size214221//63850//64856//NITZ4_001490-RA/size214221-snap-gene-0.114-mRNA-1//-1//CDS//3329534990//9211//frame0